MVFPVVVYGCESWIRKKAEHQRIDAFKLWCWRSLEGSSNQSILKEISSEYSLEGLTRKPKLQYFGPLMQRGNSLEKTQVLGKIEGRGRRRVAEDEMVGSITSSMDLTLNKLLESEGQGSLACCSPWGCKELGMT